MSAAVLVLGLVITAVLAWVTAHDYGQNEHRLLALQAQLTTDAIAAADPLYVEDHLGGAVKLAAATNGDASVFKQAVSSSVTAKGFATVSLWRVSAAAPRLVAVVGGRSLLSPAKAAALVGRAETSTSFLVTTLTAPHAERIAYAVPAKGPGGTFVAFAEQPLPANHRISVPPSSPLAQLNLAVYLGRAQNAAALLETDSTAPLPLRGTTYTQTIPFGDTMLTVTTSPRSSLSGIIPKALPWAITAGGVLTTLLAVLAIERLVRGRDAAAHLTEQVTHLYMEQRSVAETLQRALLPRTVPSFPGLEIAVRYRAAAEKADVGGDWYDVVPVDEDRFVFVIGDVSGHDVRAAAVMASLHFACRAYALEGHPPAVILGRLRRMLDVTRDGHLATVLCGLVEVKEHRVTLANAGHLPPLVAGGADAWYPSVRPSPPIGIPESPVSDPVVVTVPAAGLLIAYTDGLIERRNETLDIGMKRLADAVTGHASSADDLLDRVITELTGDGPSDDVALIGLKWLT
ncbi:MAG TPA: PP2C family protein-serine/threonine phosphatase [Trebonia sp.]|nr:PP2C family protein-serine/threonine phosphatase [Trebonia sp.]